MNSRDLHIFTASGPGELSLGSPIPLIASSRFKSPRDGVVSHARPNIYQVSTIFNLHDAEHYVSQFAPGRQIFSCDYSHPFLNLPLQVSNRAKFRNDMK